MLPSKNYHSATLDSCYIELFQVTTDKKKVRFGYYIHFTTDVSRYTEMNKSRTKLLETYRIKLGHRAFVRSNALIKIPKYFPYLY